FATQSAEILNERYNNGKMNPRAFMITFPEKLGQVLLGMFQDWEPRAVQALPAEEAEKAVYRQQDQLQDWNTVLVQVRRNGDRWDVSRTSKPRPVVDMGEGRTQSPQQAELARYNNKKFKAYER